MTGHATPSDELTIEANETPTWALSQVDAVEQVLLAIQGVSLPRTDGDAREPGIIDSADAIATPRS